MVPLATNLRVLTFMNICPLKESATKNEKMMNVANIVIIMIIQFSMMVGSLLFLLRNWSINLELAFLAFFQLDAITNLIYMTISAYILRKKITAVFGHLTEIYNESNYLFLLFAFDSQYFFQLNLCLAKLM